MKKKIKRTVYKIQRVVLSFGLRKILHRKEEIFRLIDEDLLYFNGIKWEREGNRIFISESWWLEWTTDDNNGEEIYFYFEDKYDPQERFGVLRQEGLFEIWDLVAGTFHPPTNEPILTFMRKVILSLTNPM